MSEILPKIDQFSIIEEIYTRNAIKLFKVTDDGGNYLALKMLQEDTPQKVKQFEKEIAILKSLSHISNVPKVHSVQKFHGNVYYTMDYINGISLLQYINQHQRLNETITLRIIKDIATVVNEIHKKDVIHCDLSPANIMLQNNNVFVIDFGIALTEKDLVVSNDREFKGTLNYVSPEQANSEYSRIGFWSDIYSLGAIMYHMVTGTPPFAGDNNITIMHNIAQGKLQQINDYKLDIPEKVQLIIYKALQNKISNRYTNIKDFVSDINQVLPSEQSFNKKKTGFHHDVLQETMCFKEKDLPTSTNFDLSANIVPIDTNILSNNVFVENMKQETAIDESIKKALQQKHVSFANNQKKHVGDSSKPKLRTNHLRRTARNTKKPSVSNHFVLIVGICIGITTSLIFVILFSSNSQENKESINADREFIKNNTNNENKERGVTNNQEKKGVTNNQEKKEVFANKEENINSDAKNNNPWLTPVQIGSMYYANWTLQDGVWHGTSDQPFGLMVIRDFASWQNYTYTAEFFIVRGKLGIFMRGFASTAQFPDFLGQMKVANPKNQWYTVTAVANGSRLSVKVDGIDTFLTSVDSTLENSGIVGFGLQPEFTGVPALVYVKNIRLQKLP